MGLLGADPVCHLNINDRSRDGSSAALSPLQLCPASDMTVHDRLPDD